MSPGASAAADMASEAKGRAPPGVGLFSAAAQTAVCVEHGVSQAMVRSAKPPTGWVTVNGSLTPRAQRASTRLRFTPQARRVSVGPPRFALGRVFAAYARAAVVALVLLLTGSAFAGTVNIALVPVGDAGNVADPATSFGAVAYPYSMGEYDVTMGQYAAFLNAVATTGDPYGLYNSEHGHGHADLWHYADQYHRGLRLRGQGQQCERARNVCLVG